jgi:hypothetical protein
LPVVQAEWKFRTVAALNNIVGERDLRDHMNDITHNLSSAT